jgi:hypothetical protein
VSQRSFEPKELEDLERALNSQTKAVDIRLREGEYQFSLAKAIASFEMEFRFPNVKDLVRKLFGEKRTEDPQFLSKIQTILKKMAKSGVIKILPKEKPWELQRYALLSFKFEDVEKTAVIFATEDEIEKARKSMRVQSKSEVVAAHQTGSKTLLLVLLVSVIIISFAVVVWAFMQPNVNSVVFLSALCLTALASLVVGTLIVKRK